MNKPNIFLVNYLLPMGRQPLLENAFLKIQNGKITSLGLANELASGFDKGCEVFDYRDKEHPSVLMPGLVNSHTHLSYPQIPLQETQDAIDWLKNIIIKSRQLDSPRKQKIAQQNIQAILKSGCSFVVENTPFEESIEALANSPLKALVGLEVFGNTPEATNQALEAATNRLKANVTKYQALSNKMHFGLSPHSIYNVSQALLDKLIYWCIEHDQFLLIHLAEFVLEKELFENNHNSDENSQLKKLLNLYDGLSLAKPNLGNLAEQNNPTNSLEYFCNLVTKNNALLGKNWQRFIATHLIHGQTNNADTLNQLRQGLISFCLRSNQHLHQRTPNKEFLESLASKASFATDGLSSNLDFDLLLEVKHNYELFLEQGINYSPQALLEGITSVPARQFDGVFTRNFGQIKKNYSADFVILKLQNCNLTTQNICHEIITQAKDLQRELWIDGYKTLI